MRILNMTIFNERDEMMAARLLSLRQRGPEEAKQIDDFLMVPTPKKVRIIAAKFKVHPDIRPDKYSGYFVALHDFLSYSDPMKQKLIAYAITGPMPQIISVESLKLVEDDRQRFLNEQKKKADASAAYEKELDEVRLRTREEEAKVIAEAEKKKARVEVLIKVTEIWKQGKELFQYLTRFTSLSPQEMKKEREAYIRNNTIFMKLVSRFKEIEEKVSQDNYMRQDFDMISKDFDTLSKRADILLMQKELVYGKDGEEKMLTLFQRYREELLEMRKDLKQRLNMLQSNEFDNSRLNFIVNDVNGLKENVLSTKKENMTDEFREKFFVLVAEIENDKAQIFDLLVHMKKNIAKQQDVKAQQDVKEPQEYEALLRLQSLSIWWGVTRWEEPKTVKEMGSFVCKDREEAIEIFRSLQGIGLLSSNKRPPYNEHLALGEFEKQKVQNALKKISHDLLQGNILGVPQSSFLPMSSSSSSQNSFGFDEKETFPKKLKPGGGN